VVADANVLNRRLAEVVKKDALPKSDHVVYTPGMPVSVLCDKQPGLIQVRIPAKFLCYNNKVLRSRQLWGTDLYTDESDLVAIAAHMGLFCPAWNPPLLHMLVLYVKLEDGSKRTYEPSCRYGLESRGFSDAYDGYAVHIEKCCILKSINSELPSAENRIPARSALGSLQGHHDCPPSIQWPVDQSLVVSFSLSNDAWQRYSLWAVADGGPDPSQWTSYRLKSEVLFVETRACRYELSVEDTSSEFLLYRWAEVSEPTKLDGHEMRKLKVPLEGKYVRVVSSKLDWEDLAWGHSQLQIRGITYPLTRFLWKSVE
jgi:hypothetical protein